MDEKPEHETETNSTSPGEQPGTDEPHELGQQNPKKEPLPSEITYAKIQAAGRCNDYTLAGKLAHQYAREARAEREAKKLAEERAAQEAMVEDLDDEEYEEELAENEPVEVQPDQIYTIRAGESLASTAGLDMLDLIRREDVIEGVQFISAEDGVIKQYCTNVSLRWHLRSLYESLILPSGILELRTARQLFDDISMLLYTNFVLPRKDSSLLAYWAMSTWFTDHFSFFPSVIISGPESTADLLLRTLAAVCRRPVLLGELSSAILRKLPINELTPTLLIRQPHFSRHISALLNASNQPGYLFSTGNTFQQFYCPKCIYVGECLKDAPAMSNSVHINLSGSALRPRHSLPTGEGITSFQNRLFWYRLLNYDKVAAAKFRVSGFRPEISVMADVLAAPIVDDPELQRGVIELLKDSDEQARVDRATGVNGLVLRAVLFHCHEKDQRKFVREIAATSNRLYAEDGDSLNLSSEKVGHVLKDLGLYTRRLGNAGRGLMFDKTTQSHAHSLGQVYDVLAVEPTCEYCHQVQQPQSEEVVQDV